MSKDIKCPECNTLLDFHDLMPDQVKNDLRKNLDNNMPDNPYEGVHEFYDKLTEFVESEKQYNNSNKVVLLFRLALELGGGDDEMGLQEMCYLMAKLQYTTLGIVLGKDETFNGILEQFDISFSKPN
ncbi:hypothetical protein OAE09_05655 [Alphaproteobacteria bacterium]|nr:hypothetical protein [Alphaproteobacteria bacterium]